MRSSVVKESIGVVLHRTYQKTRVPLAYGLVVAAVGLRYLPWSFAPEVALLALGFLLLTLFFEIHKAVTASDVTNHFRSFSEAIPYIDRATAEYLQRARPATIRCLGVALYYQWPFLEDVLARLLNESRTQLSVEITMLDPTWKDMDYFNDAWSAQVQGNYARLQSFMQQHEGKFADLKWTMKIYLYRSLPPWYGILLGDDTLFLGTSYWDHDKLKAGQNVVECFRASDVPRGSAKIHEFIGWFDHSKTRRIELTVLTTSGVIPAQKPAALPPS